MKVSFFAQGVRRPPGEARARRGIDAVLKKHRVRAAGELNVVWVSRGALRALGKAYRGADKFTDVISFRYDAEAFPGTGPAPFGDLYISPEQARLNARRFAVPFEEECVRLCVHGALHLLDYRDYKPAEKARMWKVQEPIVKKAMAGRA